METARRMTIDYCSEAFATSEDESSSSEHHAAPCVVVAGDVENHGEDNDDREPVISEAILSTPPALWVEIAEKFLGFTDAPAKMHQCMHGRRRILEMEILSWTSDLGEPEAKLRRHLRLSQRLDIIRQVTDESINLGRSTSCERGVSSVPTSIAGRPHCNDSDPSGHSPSG